SSCSSTPPIPACARPTADVPSIARRTTTFAPYSPEPTRLLVELRRGAVGSAAGGIGCLTLLPRVRLRTVGGALGLARLALEVACTPAELAPASLLCLLLAAIGNGGLLRARRPGRGL